MTLAMLALFAISVMRPFYFEELRGFSVQKSGLLLTLFPLAIAVVAPVSGSLADRIGSRWLAAGGLALACLGLVFLARLTQGAPSSRSPGAWYSPGSARACSRR